jgi:hypothetical protein
MNIWHYWNVNKAIGRNNSAASIGAAEIGFCEIQSGQYCAIKAGAIEIGISDCSTAEDCAGSEALAEFQSKRRRRRRKLWNG